MTGKFILIYLLFSEPPGPPTNLKVVDTTKSSITLGWGKPVYDGGAPIIGYIVEMRPKREDTSPDEGWKRCNAAAQLVRMEFTVTSLDENQEYEFRVCAQNQAGIGRPAELKDAIKPKEILGETLFYPRIHSLNASRMISPHSEKSTNGFHVTCRTSGD